MGLPYFCRSPGRVEALRAAAEAQPPRLLNGIHFLEVAPGQRQLDVHFVHSLKDVPKKSLVIANVEIRGGVRVRDPQVTAVSVQENVLHVEVATPGDFSRYRLRIVTGADNSTPPAGIDPTLAEIDFSFKVDCPSDFDCRNEPVCPPEVRSAPAIDYLARDYGSFRRLLLDRLSTLMPEWRERSPADLWVALAELIAFRADELSYYQDAVATEAYLGTARRRVSVRRHTRLLDYPFHDGCNARAWVAFRVDKDAGGLLLRGCDADSGLGGTRLLTKIDGLDDRVPSVSEEAERLALAVGAQAFELLHDIRLFKAHNEIRFYTWSDEDCCLPRGATRAFLRDEAKARRLRLSKGDVLVFMATLSTITGKAADADRRQRHAVRLTKVEPGKDPLTGQRLVEIEWSEADALPFALCLSKRIGGVLHTDMAVALGNVALADHGRTIGLENSEREVLRERADGRCRRHPLAETVVAPLTQQGRVAGERGKEPILVNVTKPAAAAMQWDMHNVRPSIELSSKDSSRRWRARRDLLGSGPFADEFVVETEDDGNAVLRFGDGVHGREPSDSEVLLASYRIGNGTAGNVGAEAIAHIVGKFDGITGVRNPMPATGGVDAHPVRLAKLYAPQAFRQQERAVTPNDYAAVAEREPRVQRAVATRRWTGSWHTLFITVDRRGGEPVDAGFEEEMLAFIERYRLAGHDVEIDAPRYVALDLALHVCTKAGYFAEHVHRRLLDAFSAGSLPAGGTGFFHPDRFSFGQPVYLSSVIAWAMQVPGVDYVMPLRFQRLGRASAGELESGRIAMARLEIARLDNDPNAPEFGRLEFDVHEGA